MRAALMGEDDDDNDDNFEIDVGPYCAVGNGLDDVQIRGYVWRS